MNTKDFKIDVKSVQEDGSFEGIASVYGNVDLANEVVTKGAFKRTLEHKGSSIVLLWQHKRDEPIGIGYLEDSDNGLKIVGKLNLEVAKAKEAYALLKQGAIKGLSIGYDVVKDNWEKGVRYLKELKLWEVSVVTFPCNTAAKVVGVKAQTFSDILNTRSLKDQFYQIQDAMTSAIYGLMSPKDGDSSESLLLALSQSIDDYKTVMTSWYSAYLSQMNKKEATEIEVKEIEEIKAGRMISNANMNLIKNCVEALSALLEAAKAKSDPPDDDSDDEKAFEGLSESIKAMMDEIKAKTK